MSDLDDWPSSQQLAELFPAAYVPKRQVTNGLHPNYVHHRPRGPSPINRPLRTRVRMILSLELRGKTLSEISEQLGLRISSVSKITRTDRYIAAREALLGRMDAEFSAMKPAAFLALCQGLHSRDENTALRASETWMKAAGFGQYGRGNAQQGITAEDVAKQLLQVNVTVNTK